MDDGPIYLPPIFSRSYDKQMFHNLSIIFFIVSFITILLLFIRELRILSALS